jgi:hypothetical protein
MRVAFKEIDQVIRSPNKMKAKICGIKTMGGIVVEATTTMEETTRPIDSIEIAAVMEAEVGAMAVLEAKTEGVEASEAAMKVAEEGEEITSKVVAMASEIEARAHLQVVTLGEGELDLNTLRNNHHKVAIGDKVEAYKSKKHMNP